MDRVALKPEEEFSLNGYRRMLETARSGYSFSSFHDINPESSAVIWRHDVDFSLLAAMQLGEVDHELGISATVFVNIHADTYSALSPSGRRYIQEIIEQGHEVGLHVDAEFYGGVQNEDDLERILETEKKQFDDSFGLSPKVFSFHNPTVEIKRFEDRSYAGLVNTYAPSFFNQIAYCSDSNGYWRNESIQSVLGQNIGRSVQVLTHPEWWVGRNCQPRERLVNVLTNQMMAHIQEYDKSIEQFARVNLSQFKEKLSLIATQDSDLDNCMTILMSSFGNTETSVDRSVLIGRINDIAKRLIESF
jgi:hypothetical protein